MKYIAYFAAFFVLASLANASPSITLAEPFPEKIFGGDTINAIYEINSDVNTGAYIIFMMNAGSSFTDNLAEFRERSIKYDGAVLQCSTVIDGAAYSDTCKIHLTASKHAVSVLLNVSPYIQLGEYSYSFIIGSNDSSFLPVVLYSSPYVQNGYEAGGLMPQNLCGDKKCDASAETIQNCPADCIPTAVLSDMREAYIGGNHTLDAELSKRALDSGSVKEDGDLMPTGLATSGSPNSPRIIAIVLLAFIVYLRKDAFLNFGRKK